MKNFIKNFLLFIISIAVCVVGVSLTAHFLSNGNYKAAGIVLCALSVASLIIVCCGSFEGHGVSSMIKGYANLFKKREESETEE